MRVPAPWLSRLDERLASDADFARRFDRTPGRAVRELGVPVGEIAALLAAWHDRARRETDEPSPPGLRSP